MNPVASERARPRDNLPLLHAPLLACRTWTRPDLADGAARDWAAEGAGSGITSAERPRPCRESCCGALGMGVKTRGGRMSGAQIQAKEAIIAPAQRSLLSPRFHTPPPTPTHQDAVRHWTSYLVRQGVRRPCRQHVARWNRHYVHRSVSAPPLFPSPRSPPLAICHDRPC
jgi:hypothetical protein